MTTYKIQPDSEEWLDAARHIIKKYSLNVCADEWWDIGDSKVREEFQRLWWIEFASVINVPEFSYFGLWEPVSIHWSADHDRDLVAFILRWE